MDKLLTIAEASKILGVCTTTLRRWEKDGKLVPIRTAGNQRRYSLQALGPSFADSIESNRVTYAYARVSSHDQKEDLARQAQVLEMHCAANGWKFEIITDLGSGINYHKKGLKKLLTEIIAGRVERLVIAHKDRLLRFGAELIFAICECKNVEMVIVNKGQDTTFEEDLTKDVLEIITVFSARLYGSRSNKNKELIEAVQKAVETSNDSCPQNPPVSK
jgi:excisionase family DNA binding protein